MNPQKCPWCFSTNVSHWLMAWGVRWKCHACDYEWTELNEAKSESGNKQD